MDLIYFYKKLEEDISEDDPILSHIKSILNLDVNKPKSTLEYFRINSSQILGEKYFDRISYNLTKKKKDENYKLLQNSNELYENLFIKNKDMMMLKLMLFLARINDHKSLIEFSYHKNIHFKNCVQNIFIRLSGFLETFLFSKNLF